jgi:hypothetical protein
VVLILILKWSQSQRDGDLEELVHIVRCFKLLVVRNRLLVEGVVSKNGLQISQITHLFNSLLLFGLVNYLVEVVQIYKCFLLVWFWIHLQTIIGGLCLGRSKIKHFGVLVIPET